MSKVCFAEEGWKDYLYWQTRDKKMLRKINSLIKSIERDGILHGEGKPEKLRHRVNDYSRRMDDANRLIYTVRDDMVVIKSCKGHYEE